MSLYQLLHYCFFEVRIENEEGVFLLHGIANYQTSCALSLNTTACKIAVILIVFVFALFNRSYLQKYIRSSRVFIG